jgi:hypothetical protein
MKTCVRSGGNNRPHRIGVVEFYASENNVVPSDCFCYQECAQKCAQFSSCPDVFC